VRKIQLNSAFGACGNEYFRYYDQDIAEAITLSGQLSIRWIERHLNDFLNKSLKTKKTEDFIIAADTDSVYLRLGKLVEQVMPQETDKQKITKFLDKFCNDVLQPFINKKYEDLAKQQNAYGQKMHMKREAIASKGIWTAKKRYMLNVFMGEENVLLGTPDLKIMGIETSRSSTPQIVRDALKESIRIIMNGTEEQLIAFVADFHDRFRKSPIHEIAFPRSCKKMSEYRDSSSIYRKSTPIAVKGSLVYNHWLKEKGLSKKYPLISEGEKIKFVYLKIPNTIREHVISFSSAFPSELGLDKYIDYDTQFEKSFQEPLRTIINCIGWKMEKTSSLEDLFA
jgi:DNA polymerase elongation subunit (family B)